MPLVIQRIDGFVNTDVAKGNGCAAIFEDLRHVIVCFQTHTAGAFHVENWRDAGFGVFQAGNTGH